MRITISSTVRRQWNVKTRRSRKPAPSPAVKSVQLFCACGLCPGSSRARRTAGDREYVDRSGRCCGNKARPKKIAQSFGINRFAKNRIGARDCDGRCAEIFEIATAVPRISSATLRKFRSHSTELYLDSSAADKSVAGQNQLWRLAQSEADKLRGEPLSVRYPDIEK